MEDAVFEYVKKADYLQVNDFLMALMKRYKELNPDYEVYLFTLPKEDGEERETQLNEVVARIRNH